MEIGRQMYNELPDCSPSFLSGGWRLLKITYKARVENYFRKGIEGGWGKSGKGKGKGKGQKSRVGI